jgi:hypothetical protein
MVQFMSINYFSWISSIFVGFFKSSRFFVSLCIYNFSVVSLGGKCTHGRYRNKRTEILFGWTLKTGWRGVRSGWKWNHAKQWAMVVEMSTLHILLHTWLDFW